ncbi:MAG: TolC family protein [Balneolaceae bacterium]|nr:TolC family protein [Balneolaceae bacterium]
MLLWAGLALPVQAQSGQQLGTLTLQEAIEIAQDQSPEARLARFDMIASQWQYRAFRADLLPSLDLSGDAPNYNRSIIPVTQPDGSVVFRDQVQSNAGAELSVNQNIPLTGGRLSLSSEIGRLGIFGGENSYLWSSTPLQAQFVQPIFQYNNLKWRNRIEPLRFEIAQKQFVQNMEQVAQRTAQNFFNVYLAQVQLENARFNRASNDSIHTINLSRYRVGDISENDLLASELELKNAQVSVSNSEIEYQRVLNNFKIFLGYSTDVSMELDAPEELPEVNVQIDRAVQLAMENNNEALRYELQEMQADANFAQQKAQSNLQMNLIARYGINKTSEDLADLYTETQNSQFLTMGFQIPIFNWGQQRAQVNAARNEQRRTATMIDYQRQQFVQGVETQVREFLQRSNQVQLARESDGIAQRRYDVAQTRYLVGDTDIEFLFQAQAQRDAARVAYIRELSRFWTGLYNLRRMTLYNFRDNQMIDYSVGME